METGIIPRNFNQNILNKTNKFKIHEQFQDLEQQPEEYMTSNLTGQRMKVKILLIPTCNLFLEVILSRIYHLKQPVPN